MQLGLDIEDLENNESDAGLGNGGIRYVYPYVSGGGGGRFTNGRLYHMVKFSCQS